MGCDARPPPEIQVNLSFGHVKYDLSKSYADLERFDITTISPYAAHEHTKVAGLTGGRIKIESDLNIAWSSSPFFDRSCFWYEDIQVNIDLDSTIYIAREHRKGSCNYTEVKNHEWKHVNTDRELLKKYQPIFETAALNAAGKLGVIGPLPQDQGHKIRKDMAGLIESTLERVADQLNRERRKRQQAIDSREEYDRLSRACKDKK